MKTTTVKGTRDFLPEEVALRDYMQNKILEMYQRNGFSRISTPILEDIENLDKSEGGENLNLIFKVLKRGEKLKNALEKGQFEALSDMGLRYDLTLPLSRYFSNNKERLMLPFKCIQIDKVFRAERPQRGRDRELMQCDIDIIGSDSLNSEIELIDVTAKALLAVGVNDFSIKINDRRLLKAILMACGIESDQIEQVCISIDKLDKIGSEGLREELLDKGISSGVTNRILDLLGKSANPEEIASLIENQEIISGLMRIINAVQTLSKGQYGIQLELSLVRGQGYYTGTIFEIASNQFQSSIGGGGRYDRLIGKFTGESVPAVGFSIGFERIFTLLSEGGFVIPDVKKKVAVIYKGEDFLKAYLYAEELRIQYDVALYEIPRKLGKFMDKLGRNGFYGCSVYGENSQIKVL